MKRILLASVAALGLAGTASAADLAVKAAPLVPVFSWSGCYLGANAGWIGGGESYRTEPWGPFFLSLAGADRALVTRQFSSNTSGGTAGGQVGCQWQWGAWVLGGEWDFNWSGLKENNHWSTPELFLVTDPTIFWDPRNYWVHKQLEWFSTARVRLGWAVWDRVLIYGTGGLAVAALDSNTHIDRFDAVTGAFVTSYFGAYRERRIGWTAGGGIEWAFANNWTAKAEFLYLDFGSFDYISPDTRAAFAATQQWRTRIDANEYVARVGLNYLFHLGPAAVPVVARY